MKTYSCVGILERKDSFFIKYSYTVHFRPGQHCQSQRDAGESSQTSIGLRFDSLGVPTRLVQLFCSIRDDLLKAYRRVGWKYSLSGLDDVMDPIFQSSLVQAYWTLKLNLETNKGYMIIASLRESRSFNWWLICKRRFLCTWWSELHLSLTAPPDSSESLLCTKQSQGYQWRWSIFSFKCWVNLLLVMERYKRRELSSAIAKHPKFSAAWIFYAPIWFDVCHNL